MQKVAIVILNWNGKHYLEKFLPVLIQHTHTNIAEIIIADNASTDNSVSFLKSEYPAIKLIELDKNYGFAGGYNKALLQIDAEFYVLLNSDVEVTENWLEPVINAMKNDAMVAAAMPKIKSYTKKTHFEHAGAAGGFIDKYGYPFCRGRILDHVEEDKSQYNTATEIFWATGACMFIRADIFHKHNGFDARFFAHMEEIDLCWRIKSTGYKIMYYPETEIFHIGGGTLNNESPFKLYLNFRNNLFMLFKNLPLQKLPFILFFRMVLDGISGIMYLLQGKYKNFLSVIKAHFHFYKNIPYLLKQRKKIKPQAKMYPKKDIYKKSVVFQRLVLKKMTFKALDYR